jgi:glycosyltransferase involved in cell wall biosynthesis
MSAELCLQQVTEPRSSPKRICMITYSFYGADTRVRRYAEALAERGDSVEVIAVRPRRNMPKEEVIRGVRVHCIQDRFGKNEKTKLSFVLPILRFVVASSRRLNRLHRQQRFALVHIHNLPDFLVFAAWYPKLQGAKIILDIHDLMAEFFISKFGKSDRCLLAWILRMMERLSAAMADHVIVSNHLWCERYKARSAPARKCSVFINYVDEALFFPRPRRRNDSKLIVMFPGGLQWHQGVDIAIRAFHKLHSRMPQAEFHIYGDGNVKEELMALVSDLGLNDVVRFFEPVRTEEIASLMADANLGVVPKRSLQHENPRVHGPARSRNRFQYESRSVLLQRFNRSFLRVRRCR